jgi:DNA-directed RNA polymerase I subunit RPA1
MRSAPNAGELLDGAMNKPLNEYTSKIIAACLPAGQVKDFPSNCMAAMTLSGAKGGMVNFSQISCCLGQQVCACGRVSQRTHPRMHARAPACRP